MRSVGARDPHNVDFETFRDFSRLEGLYPEVFTNGIQAFRRPSEIRGKSATLLPSRLSTFKRPLGKLIRSRRRTSKGAVLLPVNIVQRALINPTKTRAKFQTLLQLFISTYATRLRQSYELQESRI